jgi:hypothetical protein
MVQELPDAPAAGPGFTDNQLRRIVLHAMPVQWQSKFEDADKTVADTLLNAMSTYFDKQQANDPYKSQTDGQNKTNKKQGNQDSQNNNNRNSGGRGGRGRGRGRWTRRP